MPLRCFATCCDFDFTSRNPGDEFGRWNHECDNSYVLRGLQYIKSLVPIIDSGGAHIGAQESIVADGDRQQSWSTFGIAARTQHWRRLAGLQS